MEVVTNSFEKSIVAFEYQSKELAIDCSAVIETVFKEQVIVELDHVIGQHVPEDVFVDFDRLELDIGHINAEDLQNDLAVRVKKAFEAVLAEEFRINERGMVTKDDGFSSAMILSVLETYMLHGYVPKWWGNNQPVKAILERINPTMGQEVLRLFRTYRNNKGALVRIIEAIDRNAFERLFENMGVKDHRVIIALRNGLYGLLIENSKNYANKTSLKRHVDQLILEHVLKAPTAVLEPHELNKNILLKLFPGLTLAPDKWRKITKGFRKYPNKNHLKTAFKTQKVFVNKYDGGNHSTVFEDLERLIAVLNSKQSFFDTTDKSETQHFFLRLLADKETAAHLAKRLKRTGLLKVLALFFGQSASKNLDFIENSYDQLKPFTNYGIRLDMAKSKGGVVLISVLLAGRKKWSVLDHERLLPWLIELMGIDVKEFKEHHAIDSLRPYLRSFDYDKFNAILENKKQIKTIKKWHNTLFDSQNESVLNGNDALKSKNEVYKYALSETKKGLVRSYLLRGYLSQHVIDVSLIDIRALFENLLTVKDDFLKEVLHNHSIPTTVLFSRIHRVYPKIHGNKVKNYFKHHFKEAYEMVRAIVDAFLHVGYDERLHTEQKKSLVNKVTLSALIASKGIFNHGKFAFFVHLALFEHGSKTLFKAKRKKIGVFSPWINDLLDRTTVNAFKLDSDPLEKLHIAAEILFELQRMAEHTHNQKSKNNGFRGLLRLLLFKAGHPQVFTEVLTHNQILVFEMAGFWKKLLIKQDWKIVRDLFFSTSGKTSQASEAIEKTKPHGPFQDEGGRPLSSIDAEKHKRNTIGKESETEIEKSRFGAEIPEGTNDSAIAINNDFRLPKSIEISKHDSALPQKEEVSDGVTKDGIGKKKTIERESETEIEKSRFGAEIPDKKKSRSTNGSLASKKHGTEKMGFERHESMMANSGVFEMVYLEEVLTKYQSLVEDDGSTIEKALKQNIDSSIRHHISALRFYAEYGLLPWWSVNKDITGLLQSLQALQMKFPKPFYDHVSEQAKDVGFFDELAMVLLGNGLVELWSNTLAGNGTLKMKWQQSLGKNGNSSIHRNELDRHLRTSKSDNGTKARKPSKMIKRSIPISPVEENRHLSEDKKLKGQVYTEGVGEAINFKSFKDAGVKTLVSQYLELAPYFYFKAISPTKWRLALNNFVWKSDIAETANEVKTFAKKLAEFLKKEYPAVPWNEVFITVYERFSSTSRKKNISSFSKSFKTLMEETGQERLYDSNQKSERKSVTIAPVLGEQIKVNNAGLVLLWPFLQRLFDHFSFLENGSFANDDFQNRAIYVLQQVAFGHIDVKEYDLVLNKVLVGMPLSDHLQPIEVMTNQEINMSESVIKGLIGNWEKVKNSSVAGIRETFLQRDGLLSFHENKYLLQVPRKGVDVLLDSIPWNITLIKLKWMEMPLQVEWTKP